MSELYPLKFETVLKEKVWEGMLLFPGLIKSNEVRIILGESLGIVGRS